MDVHLIDYNMPGPGASYPWARIARVLRKDRPAAYEECSLVCKL